jgi:hypothetical protein
MHVPRFLFLAGSIYAIFLINIRQQQTQKWKKGVTSHRQEEINTQF